MDGVREFLDDLTVRGRAEGNLLGLFHVLIGRRIRKSDGTPVTAGISWRELAKQLKRARWDKDGVRQLGLDPANLPPRDREQYWYLAIAAANVASPAAVAAGDRLADDVKDAGYQIGPATGQSR